MASDSSAQREFENLLQPQLVLALNVAFRAVGSREEAEDIVQNAAIRAWKSFASFEPNSNFRAWFLKIVVNLALNVRRDAARQPATIEWEEGSSEEENSFLYNQTRAAGLHTRSDPATAFLSKIQAQEVQTALQNLPIEFRAVAALHFVGEMSYEEISAIVGCPLGTVRSRLHRARAMLQRELWEVACEMGVAPRDAVSKAKPKSGSGTALIAILCVSRLLAGTLYRSWGFWT